MNNKNSIKNLSVITPFKGSNNIKLYQTISCLYKQNLKICIHHLILYDFSSNNIQEIKENFPNKENYFLKFILIQKKGIYPAINIGLDLLEKESYYIIIGAGDLIFFNDIKKIDIDKLLMCQYKLSHKNKNINILRNIYSGMPYCHNAIIFKVNHLRYSNKYMISSDYDYFLKFIEYEKINIFTDDYFNNKINMIFESENGISSKSFFRKNIENLSVLQINFGFKYALFYLLLKTKKLLKIIYE